MLYARVFIQNFKRYEEYFFKYIIIKLLKDMKIIIMCLFIII